MSSPGEAISMYAHYRLNSKLDWMAVSGDIASTFVDLLLRSNRRLMFIIRRNPPALPINFSHVLTEIGHTPGIGAREICDLIHLEKSTVSRIISQFEKEGIVSTKVSPHDKRGKHNSLTAAGKKLFAEDSRQRNEIAELYVAPLSPTKQKLACDYIFRFGDALHAPSEPIREGDAPIKIAIRRLTRMMGFLGHDTMKTGYPIDLFQLLCGVGLAENHTQPLARLKAAFPYDPSNFSRMIQWFSRHGLMKRENREHDNRHIELSLTSRGVKKFREAFDSAKSLVTTGLEQFSSVELDEFIGTMQGFLSEPRFWQDLLENQMRVKLIENDVDRASARAFIMTELVRAGEHHAAPEVIAGKDSIIVALIDQSETHTIMELQKSADGKWAVCCVASKVREPEPFLIEMLLHEALNHVEKRSSDRTLRVAAGAPGQHLIRTSLS